MALKICFNHGEDQFPLPAEARRRYGPFGFPKLPRHRAWVTSNFVQTLDGCVSFRDFPRRASGAEISQSGDDRWLLRMLRAHHDAQLLGAGTLRGELGPDGGGWDYGCFDAAWERYRRRRLGRGPAVVYVVTASGALDLGARVFRAPATEAFVLTTAAGAARLARRPRHKAMAGRIFALGRGDKLDPKAILDWIFRRGARTVICECGPSLYAQLFGAGLVDEEFRTISLRVAGVSARLPIRRPTAYGDLSFTPATAPWERLISLHAAPPHHLFVRARLDRRARRAGARDQDAAWPAAGRFRVQPAPT